MNAILNKKMEELHKRIAMAVTKSIKERGITEQEAFRNHMNELLKTTPRVFEAYAQWLKETAN